MRLKATRLTDIEVYRKVSHISAYIGRENSFESVGTIQADVQPYEDKLNDNPYGKDISELIMLFISPDADIKENDRLIYDNRHYDVKSVMHYKSHIKAVAKLDA